MRGALRRNTRQYTALNRAVSMVVADARGVLARAVAADLPALEEAIRAGDYDTANLRSAVVRAARLQVRAALGGGEQSGPLREEWFAVESRIDVALRASPRPLADQDADREAWLERRRTFVAALPGG